MLLYHALSDSIGAWLSLVERCVRDAEVAGSNPVAPTTEGKRDEFFGNIPFFIVGARFGFAGLSALPGKNGESMKIFGMGGLELVIILVIVLIIFGPKNLPKLGKALGKGVAGLRKGVESGKEKIDEKFEEAEAERVEEAAAEAAEQQEEVADAGDDAAAAASGKPQA